MKQTISSILLPAVASFALFSSEVGAAGTQQNVSVRGSVINEARNGAKSEMDIGSVSQRSGRTANQQTTVHIKGSVINEASGHRKNSSVRIGSR